MSHDGAAFLARRIWRESRSILLISFYRRIHVFSNLDPEVTPNEQFNNSIVYHFVMFCLVLMIKGFSTSSCFLQRKDKRDLLSVNQRGYILMLLSKHFEWQFCSESGHICY